MLNFLLGALAATAFFTFAPPAVASRMSWALRDGLTEMRAWWKRSGRRGGE